MEKPATGWRTCCCCWEITWYVLTLGQRKKPIATFTRCFNTRLVPTNNCFSSDWYLILLMLILCILSLLVMPGVCEVLLYVGYLQRNISKQVCTRWSDNLLLLKCAALSIFNLVRGWNESSYLFKYQGIDCYCQCQKKCSVTYSHDSQLYLSNMSTPDVKRSEADLV